MKKFALTAVALAVVSGSALAATVEMPEGFRAVDVEGKIPGIVEIQKQDANGEWKTHEYHALSEGTLFVQEGGDAYVNSVPSAYLEQAQKETADWNSSKDLGGKLPSFGNGEAMDQSPDGDFGFDHGVDGQPGFGSGNIDQLPGFGNGEAFDPEIDGDYDNHPNQLPGFGNGEAGGIDPDFGNGEAFDPEVDGDYQRPERPDNKPTPGAGEGSVERPRPGQGEGSVERPRPGAGEGSVERPQPGQDNRPGAGSGTNKPFPGNGSAVERPQPPAFIGQINQNKDAISQMGNAFEQRVDVVNGYLSQAGQAIANNSDRINGLQGAFEAQAAHTSKEIARLDGRIDALEEKTDKMKAGIAGATAIATLSQYHGEGQHHFAFGIGAYDGEQAMAAGYTYAFDDKKTTIRATLALDSQSDVAMGASIGHSW